jgi:predicted transcriptional regulator
MKGATAMNFNIYLDEPTGKRLARAATRVRKSRKAVIREAVRGWLERVDTPAWPEVVMRYEGADAGESFESHRSRLRPPPNDPLV